MLGAARTRKSYRSAFTLEPSKLTRIAAIISEQFQAVQLSPVWELSATYSDGRTIDLDTVGTLIETDNSHANPITRVVMEASARDDQRRLRCNIDYGGGYEDITLE